MNHQLVALDIMFNEFAVDFDTLSRREIANFIGRAKILLVKTLHFTEAAVALTG